MKIGAVNIKALRASARTLGQSGQVRQMRSAVASAKRTPTPVSRVRSPLNPLMTARSLDREASAGHRNKPTGR